ncbi:tape measure protein [Microbacterium sp. GXF6406]
MDRPVKVVLSATVEQYVAQMNKAKEASKEVKNEAKKSAEDAQKAWEVVGKGMLAVGGAVLSVGSAMLVAGVQYNAMQQNTRAALTTLLGSAAAANAQMDKLDEFATTSPFAKTTFIKAQQQMLAFGIETEKVIPYLAAIGDATAAAGGSNQQIEEISAIMAKISSSSKITAEDLNQFGNHGINAAELIGIEMGKTGAQIRKDITAGTLGADEALDALVGGMNSKFEGASENVKMTFSGAMDRVSAAWRDLSAELAEPLVSQNGGGMLVDALNLAADLMRGFQALPEPVKAATVTIVGLTSATVAFRGASMLAGPKLTVFTESLRTLGFVGGGVRGALNGVVGLLGGPWGVAMIAAGAGLAILYQELQGTSLSADEAANAIKNVADTSQLIAKVADNGGEGLRKFTGETLDLNDALDQLKNVGEEVGVMGSVSLAGLKGLDLAGVANDVEALGDGFAQIAAEDLPQATEAFSRMAEEQGLSNDQVLTFINSSDALRAELVRQADALGQSADDQTLVALLMGQMNTQAQEQAERVAAITGAAEDASGAIDQLAQDILNFGSAEIDVRESTRKFEESVWALTDSFSTNGSVLNEHTTEGIANGRALDDLISKTVKLSSDTLIQTGSQEAANAVLENGRQKLYAQRDAYVAAGGKASDFDKYVRSIPESVGTDLDITYDTRPVTNALDNIPREITTRVRSILIPGVGTVNYGYGGSFATGGAVHGPGSTTSDSIPARLSNGEHVLTAKDVQKMGGQAAVYGFRQGLHQYAKGGSVGSASDAPSTSSVGGVTITGGNFGYDPESIGRGIEREASIKRRLARQ